MTEDTPKVKSRFLAEAVRRKRTAVRRERGARSVAELRGEAAERSPARPWAEALRGPGTAVIAEIKRRSPSAGDLAVEVDVAARARLYSERGAAAVSVLTDAAFDGALADLEAVAPAAAVPVLRKDFLVDPWQVWESRAAGADAALLIVAAVDDAALEAIAAAAEEAGLGLLVEIHAEEEADRATAIDPEVIGVNARDLRSLEVSLPRGLATVAGLRERLGDSVILVAESGVSGPEDVARARDAGADAVLVGEHLMRSPRPGAALAALVEAGGSGP